MHLSPSSPNDDQTLLQVDRAPYEQYTPGLVGRLGACSKALSPEAVGDLHLAFWSKPPFSLANSPGDVAMEGGCPRAVVAKGSCKSWHRRFGCSTHSNTGDFQKYLRLILYFEGPAACPFHARGFDTLRYRDAPRCPDEPPCSTRSQQPSKSRPCCSPASSPSVRSTARYPPIGPFQTYGSWQVEKKGTPFLTWEVYVEDRQSESFASRSWVVAIGKQGNQAHSIDRGGGFPTCTASCSAGYTQEQSRARLRCPSLERAMALSGQTTRAQSISHERQQVSIEMGRNNQEFHSVS